MTPHPYLASKAGRKEMRRLMGLAHERELSAAFETLEHSFRLWRDGKISALELDERIHEHHQGPQRELWLRYQEERPNGMVVGYAVALGILKEGELSPQLLEALRGAIAYYRDEE